MKNTRIATTKYKKNEDNTITVTEILELTMTKSELLQRKQHLMSQQANLIQRMNEVKIEYDKVGATIDEIDGLIEESVEELPTIG